MIVDGTTLWVSLRPVLIQMYFKKSNPTLKSLTIVVYPVRIILLNLKQYARSKFISSNKTVAEVSSSPISWEQFGCLLIGLTLTDFENLSTDDKERVLFATQKR